MTVSELDKSKIQKHVLTRNCTAMALNWENVPEQLVRPGGCSEWSDIHLRVCSNETELQPY